MEGVRLADCEICGTYQMRRKRTESGKLVCWQCYYRLAWSKEELVRKTRQLDKEVDSLEARIPPRVPSVDYKYNSPFSAIPPIDVLKNAIIALDIGGTFSEYSQVLGDYYGINAPPYYANDEKIPDGAIACYYPTENEVYAFRKRALSHETAFHEFYHALQNFGIVPKKNSEKNADLYAKGCVRRLNQ